jgi:hypothetical protein
LALALALALAPRRKCAAQTRWHHGTRGASASSACRKRHAGATDSTALSSALISTARYAATVFPEFLYSQYNCIRIPTTRGEKSTVMNDGLMPGRHVHTPTTRYIKPRLAAACRAGRRSTCRTWRNGEWRVFPTRPLLSVFVHLQLAAPSPGREQLGGALTR